MNEKLCRLDIAGFRSFRRVEALELRDINVLIGANGSGKSNFLSFFQMLSFMMRESLQEYVGRKGGASSLLHFGPKRTPVMNAILEFVGREATSRYQFSLAHAQPDRLLFTDETVEFHRSREQRPFSRGLGAGHFESMLPELSQGAGSEKLKQVARVFHHRLSDVRAYHFHDTSDEANIRLTQDID